MLIKSSHIYILRKCINVFPSRLPSSLPPLYIILSRKYKNNLRSTTNTFFCMISRRSLLHFRNVPSSRFLYCSIRNRTFHMLNPRDAILPTQKNREMCAGILIGNKLSECLERLQVENLFCTFKLNQTWPKPLLWKGKTFGRFCKGEPESCWMLMMRHVTAKICSSFPIVLYLLPLPLPPRTVQVLSQRACKSSWQNSTLQMLAVKYQKRIWFLYRLLYYEERSRVDWAAITLSNKIIIANICENPKEVCDTHWKYKIISMIWRYKLA